MVIDRRFLDDGIGLQVGQVSQLGLADAMIAQAFYDAADFWVGSQSAVGSAQCTGSGRRWPAGDDLTLMAYLEAVVGVFEDFHLCQFSASLTEIFTVFDHLGSAVI